MEKAHADVSNLLLQLLDDGRLTDSHGSDVPDGEDWKDYLNPNSFVTLTGCKLEPSFAEARTGTRYQFECLGYFCLDSVDFATDALVSNRTVTLKDSWAKVKNKGGTAVGNSLVQHRAVGGVDD